MTPLKRSALTVAFRGLGMSAVAFVLNGVLAPGPRVAQSFALAITLGAAMFVAGCIFLARAKGRPWYFGLLGFFSCIGLAILWFAVSDGPNVPDGSARPSR